MSVIRELFGELSGAGTRGEGRYSDGLGTLLVALLGTLFGSLLGTLFGSLPGALFGSLLERYSQRCSG